MIHDLFSVKPKVAMRFLSVDGAFPLHLEEFEKGKLRPFQD